jgi:tRNA(Ile)-lysidine synthase
MTGTKANRIFLEFIREKELIRSDGKILLAVSGGIDSVLMAKLFYMNNLPFDIAHINFGLRGAESDGDEAFVRDLAKSYQVKFFTKSFDTRKFASEKKISIEMAARDLRNEWLPELMIAGNYQSVALGHHKSDHLETVLMNLTKGTSIRGLRGIKPRSGIYIRPMLFATREEIVAFAHEFGIAWRSDSTNAEIKFQRNLIRANVVPELKKINPSIEGSVFENTYYLGLIETFMNDRYQELYSDIVSPEANDLKINIEGLVSSGMSEFFLFEFLKPFRFNSRIIRKIFQSLNTESGKVFHSEKHELLIDRETLILSEKSTFEKSNELIIHEPGTYLFEGKEITIENTVRPNITDLKNPAFAFFDTVVLIYPLIVRYWKPGDYFYPFGMNKSKKLSDFFIDEKVPMNQKRRMMVVESEGEICWIVGMRIDNRFRIEEQTRYIVKISTK